MQMPMDTHTVKQKIHSARLPFIENLGQIKQPGILYYADTLKGRVLVDHHGRIHYDSGIRSLIEIPNAILPARVKGKDRSQAQINYLIGSDPEKHKKDIPAFNQLDFGAVWPGISVRLQARVGNIEKIFHVAPHTDPSAISLGFENALSVTITPEGQLVVNTAAGPVTFTRPRAFQDIDGKIRDVETAYMLIPGKDNCQYGFVVGAYDKDHELVIDPLLAGTYFGGDDRDVGSDIALNSIGDVYITGSTRSESLPSTGGAFQTTFLSDPDDERTTDAFVAKFTSDLSQLKACTYFGGSRDDEAVALSIDSSDRIWIAGITQSCIDFPTTSTAFEKSDPELGWCDAGFVAKFSGGNLGYLEASTLVTGGSRIDDVEITDIDVDSNLKPYITGVTGSYSFPVTAGAYQTEKHDGFDDDGFVAKLEWNLSAVTAATYLVGSGWDDVTAIDVTPDGVYVAGFTPSADFITCADGAGGALKGDQDAFVARLNTDLTWMITSRFLGGSEYEKISDLLVDGNRIYVAGYTKSQDFPVTQGAYSTVFPEYGLKSYGDGIFISALSNTGLTLKNSTFLGGGGGKTSLLTDGSGMIYIAGTTGDDDFPTTPGAFNETTIGTDGIFISKMDIALTNLAASTFLGGRGIDASLKGMTRDKKGNIYILGNTPDENFPVTDTAWKKQYTGDNQDIVIARLNSGLSALEQYPEASLSRGHVDFGQVSPASQSRVSNITINNSGDGELVFPDTGITQTGDQFIIENDLCSDQTIQPGGTCSFGVRFTPGSIGIKTSTVKITSSAGPLSLTLSGEGRLLGDLDKSGQVNLLDLALSLKPLAAKNIDVRTASEDITGDGRIDLKESIFIAQNISGGGVSPEDKILAEQKVEEAMPIIRDKDYTAARVKFEQALALDPDNPEANAGLSLAVMGENREMRSQTLSTLFKSLADNDLSFGYSFAVQLMQMFDDLPFISMSSNRAGAALDLSASGLRSAQGMDDFDLHVANGLKEIVLRVTQGVPLMDMNYFATMTTLKSLLKGYSGILEFILPYIRKAQAMPDLKFEVPVDTFKDMFNYDLDGDGTNDFSIPGDTVCIDQGDFYLIDAVISLVLGLGQTFDAYSFEGSSFEIKGDVNQDGYIEPDEYLPPKPYYTLVSGGAQNLALAKQHFITVVEKLDTGLIITLNEPVDYYELLPVNSDPEFKTWLQSLQKSDESLDLEDLKGLTNGVYTMDLSKEPFFLQGQVIRAEPMKFFDNPKDLRDYLPAIKISDQTMAYPNDPSLGGNIPDEDLADVLNFALGKATLESIPIIDVLTPDQALPGTVVTLEGKGFGDAMGNSTLQIAQRPVPESAVTSWSDTQVSFKVPADIISGRLVVTVDNIRSNSKRVIISGMTVDNFDEVAFASPAGTPPTTIDSGLFVYDIYDTESPSGASASDWKIADGYLKEGSDIYRTGGSTNPDTNLARGSNLIMKNRTFSDGILTVGFGVDTGSFTGTDNDGIGVIFRYQDENNFYRVMSVRDDYWDKGPWTRLEKWVDGVLTVLGSSTAPEDVYKSAADDDMQTGDINEFQVEVQGTQIKVYLRQYENGSWASPKQIFDVTDSQFSSGRVGVSTYSMWWAFIDYIGIQ
jgi:hypothetical protein